MAATIQIHEMSALETGVDKTDGTVRFKDADNNTVDSNNPLQVPESGSIYSYTKKLRAYMSVAPEVQVDNLRWYSDGANGMGTGVSVNAKNLGITWGANYKTAMVGGTDLFSFTSAAPLDGDGTDVSPFVPADALSYIGDLIELQMAIADTASNGQVPSETLTLAYDEI
jgi:hypothetical protein